MHQHGGRVALPIAQISMGDGGGGKDSFVVLVVRARLAQADGQVFNQLRKMSSALLIAERNAVEFTTLFRPRQPLFDDTGGRAQQYRSHSLLLSAFTSTAIECCAPCEYRNSVKLEAL